MSQSEVARLRQNIESTCQAMNRALNGFSVSARHEIIHNKYRALGVYQEQLEKLVGQDEALTTMVETYNKIVK